jgi:hypothetical protein
MLFRPVKRVARKVAVGIVHVFEVVEIREDDPERPSDTTR